MKNRVFFLLLWIPCLLTAQDLKTGDCLIHDSTGTKYCFAADSSTFDPLLGDSYRILVISNLADGSELARHYMKVNLAADFGYEFKSEYMEDYGLLVIQGAQAFYLYHIETGVLSDYIKPSHEDCAFSDNQGTYIHNLKIHDPGSILQLDVKECGTRFFDISAMEKIREVPNPLQRNRTNTN